MNDEYSKEELEGYIEFLDNTIKHYRHKIQEMNESVRVELSHFIEELEITVQSAKKRL